MISFLFVFGKALRNSDGKETHPFLSILLTKCDTNNSMAFIGLSWDYMGVNGNKTQLFKCSINVLQYYL